MFTGLYVVFIWRDSPTSIISNDGVVNFEIYPQKNKQSSQNVGDDKTKSAIQTDAEIVKIAKDIGKSSKTVLVTMINDAYLPFTYSWLCNTKEMNIHNSVLIITTDQKSKDSLKHDWPEIHVVAMDMGGASGDQIYSHVGYVQIMIRRTEMLLSIVMADVEMFLFEVDCLWLTNPVPELQKMNDFDVLVNPVAQRTGVYAGGFLYLFRTDKAKALWKELTNQMQALGERIKSLPKDKYISEGDNDQMYFSALIVKKYNDIQVKELPLETYADGKWYEMPEAERKASHPLIINNNWVLGNEKKKERAIQWGHWFVKDDLTCDMVQVKKVLY